MKLLRLLALLAAFSFVAATCGSDDEPEATEAEESVPEEAEAEPAEEPAEEAPADEGEDDGLRTIVIGTTDSISNLDSADAYAVHDWELIRNTGDGLTKFVPGTTELEPGIAESWEISDDGLTWTFTLRDSVTFGDGTPLTAEHYVVHINRMLELDGSGAVGGALGVPYIADVEAPDESTVVFTLHNPVAYFAQIVAGPPYVPSPPSFPADALVEFPEAPFYGVGPWTITEYDPAEQTVLEPNEFYYGDPPDIDRVIIRYYEEAQPMVLALQNGEIDIAWRSVSEPGLLEELAGTEGIVSAEVPGGGIRFLILNHTLGETTDQNVRQAIAAAIDRDDIVDRAMGGLTEPLYSPIPPGFLGANEVYDELYASPDVDAATEFLAAAGYTADNPLELALNYPPDRYGGTVGDAMQILAEQLEATGAITVELAATEWATYLGEVTGGEAYPVSFLGWFFDYPDPSNYIEPFVLNGGLGTNVTDADTGEPTAGLTDPTILDLVNQAAVTTDEAERADLYGQVQQIYAEDVITIPLWFEPERVFYWDYISGDTAAEAAESLNIGPTTEFVYDLLQTSE